MTNVTVNYKLYGVGTKIRVVLRSFRIGMKRKLCTKKKIIKNWRKKTSVLRLCAGTIHTIHTNERRLIASRSAAGTPENTTTASVAFDYYYYYINISVVNYRRKRLLDRNWFVDGRRRRRRQTSTKGSLVRTNIIKQNRAGCNCWKQWTAVAYT